MAPLKELVAAICGGDAAKVKKLIQGRPQLVRHWQPLMEAAFRGQAQVARCLLEAGADPNLPAKTSFKHRPLHRAVEYKKSMPKTAGHLETVRLLLAAGADVTARGTVYQVTPIALAAMAGAEQLLEPMLQKLPTRDLFAAAAIGDLATAAGTLRQHPELAQALDINGWPPLAYCAASRMHRAGSRYSARLVKIAELLLELGADANQAVVVNEKWRLPVLYFAAGAADHPRLVEVLLRHGANPNDGESLFHAAENLHVRCLEVLLAAGGDLNFTGHAFGNTPLWFLLSQTSTRGVPLLLELGADPNVRSGENRETALHAAARRGCNNKLLGLLLRHGADPHARDTRGRTALEIARQCGHSRAAAFLRAGITK